jgi:EAL domain-containing protein (putative c-di-GMP-specific phosphodiesterase class I)
MGLIVPVGDWILRKSCEQAHCWHLAFARERALTMSVNVSGRQFAQSDLVTRIEKMLRETEVDPKAIKLEITESVTIV